MILHFLNIILISTWSVVLFIFLFYFVATVLFRIFSYRFDQEHFAGNQVINKLDPELKYYIIIPCYNEGSIIVRTIKKALAFKQVELVVVDDASNDDSIKKIEEIKSSHFHLLRRYEPNAHTGKGDVLNFGLDYIRKNIKKNHENENKTIIGVIDADAQLAGNAIECLDRYFSSPNSIIVQMRVKMYPHFKNSLQIFQDVEFFSVNHMAQIMRMYTHTVGLSGNGQFFRLKPIREKIGLHPWGQALLDDYELTIRLMKVGIIVDYMTDTFVYQEALTSIKKFIKQRGRWAQGDLDCLRYLPSIIRNKNLTITQKIGIYYFLAQPWLSMLADITIILTTITAVGEVIVHFKYLHFSILDIGLILGVILLISCFCGVIEVIIYKYDLKYFNELSPKNSALLIIIFLISYIYLVLFLSLLIAFWRWAHHQNSWVKTEHGINVPEA